MTDRAAIRQKLLQFLIEDTGLDAENIADDTSLTEGLGLDSVDFVGLIMRIEGQYHIRLTRVELEQLKVVSDLLSLIETKLQAPSAAA